MEGFENNSITKRRARIRQFFTLSVKPRPGKTHLTNSFHRQKELFTPPPRQVHRKTFNQKNSTTMDQAPAKEVTVNNERKCEGADCSNDAGSLQCPTCQKLGKEAYFCGQDCFKRNWVGQ